MKNGIILLFICLTLLSCRNSKIEYNVYINLNNCKNHEIKIEVDISEIPVGDSCLYVFPRVIPGVYEVSDFGRFINNFKAFDKSGTQLRVSKNNASCYSINSPEGVAKLEYYVTETWGEADSCNVFMPAGTKFDTHKCFLLNFHAVVGYLEGFSDAGYNITVSKPNILFGASTLDVKLHSDTTDQFAALNYKDLIQHPVLYTKPDTCSFNENNCNYRISVFSENLNITSQILKDTIEEVIRCVNKRINLRNLKRYDLLFVFDDWWNIKGGGMEFPNSMVIVLNNRYQKDDFFLKIKTLVAHEYFHIVTPLSLSGGKVRKFDYYKPQNSEHLWLYEGVVEYLSLKFLLYDKLISLENFRNRIGLELFATTKYENSKYSLTEISKNIFEKEFTYYWNNFYYRGALQAFTFDIILSKDKSKNQSLDGVLLGLYTHNSVINISDDEIAEAFSTGLSTDAADFYKRFIAGTETPDYVNVFQNAGLQVTDNIDTVFDYFYFYFHDPSIIKYTDSSIYILPDSKKNLFGEVPVRVLSIDGKPANRETVNKELIFPFENEPHTFLIESENLTEKSLKYYPARRLFGSLIYQVSDMSDFSTSQKELRKRIFNLN